MARRKVEGRLVEIELLGDKDAFHITLLFEFISHGYHISFEHLYYFNRKKDYIKYAVTVDDIAKSRGLSIREIPQPIIFSEYDTATEYFSSKVYEDIRKIKDKMKIFSA